MEIVKCIANIESYGKCELDSEYVKGYVSLEKTNDAFFLNVKAECVFYPYGYARVFERTSSLVITLKLPKVCKLMCQRLISPFWAEPAFCECTTQIPCNCQYLLTKHSEQVGFYVPIVNENYRTTIQKGENADEIEIIVSTYSPGGLKIEGTVLTVSTSDDAYDAICRGFNNIMKRNLIKTPAKSEKAYPDIFNKLGWCTWDAFYHDVSEKLIFDKMEEFKEKDIPAKWVLIDDGWSCVNDDMKLTSIYEDRQKFPYGLKHTIDVLKEKYGVESVGMWHSATGYWHGTFFEDETTLKTASGINIPSGYDFFNKWHSYLKNQGVDFVKIDCQGNVAEFLKNTPSALETTINIQNGIEKSVAENFEFMINCMGMASINMFNRQKSSVCRNSDDFFPLENDSLKSHVLQNVYNAVFTDSMFYCDFDMWWSNHPQARQNAILRAVSGGPFYISDRLGESDAEIINKFVDANGTVKRYDSTAKPVFDDIFGFDDVLKIFNTNKDGGVVAVFSFDKGGTFTLCAKDIGTAGKYVITDKFTGDKWEICPEETITLKIDKNDARMFEFTRKDSNYSF